MFEDVNLWGPYSSQNPGFDISFRKMERDKSLKYALYDYEEPKDIEKLIEIPNDKLAEEFDALE